jgi:hypothetical protein
MTSGTPGQGLENDEPATLAEQAAAALTVSEDVLAVLEEVVQRLTAVENTISENHRRGAGPEKRTDYRFELYPKADTDEDKTAQISRVRSAWERLDAWVTWLTGAYRLTSVIPPCWAEHTALREELIGLRVAWTGAWSPRGSYEAIVIWHEKLWSARTRLLDGNWGRARCDGRHDDSGIDLAESYRAWVADIRHGRALVVALDQALEAVRAKWPDNGDESS